MPSGGSGTRAACPTSLMRTSGPSTRRSPRHRAFHSGDRVSACGATPTCQPDSTPPCDPFSAHYYSVARHSSPVMGRRLCLFLVLLYVKPGAVFRDDEPTESELAAAAKTSLAAWSRDAQKVVHRKRHRRDEEMVCFESLGCFRDEGPFDYLDALPQSPETVGTKFLLTTRSNPTQPEMIHYSNMSVPSVINMMRPLKVIIHGFGSSCRRLWAREMKEALLKSDNINILCVEWESGASLPNYVQAAANTKLVGRQLALLIAELTARGITDPSQVHLIGFSLGAHVAGFTGKQVANISRISGLDPAAPLFEGYGSQFRLDPGDARFVDVIHSNGDRLLKGGLGAFEPMGHVDFYPNGGKAQAGCNNLFVGALSDLFLYRSRSEEDSRSLCNHRRAYKFFTESIDANCHMRGFACTDFERFLRGKCFTCGSTGEQCGDMGIHANHTLGRGKFYLITRDTEPLCVNQFKVEVGLVPRDRSTSYGLIELIFSDPNGFNESFPITSDSDEISHKKSIVKIIAANPLLSFTGHCQIQYVAYNGWLYRGGNEVVVNRLAITDSYGRM
uniref:Lipase domain-containing protein n=1 Tax=Strigamia maritima TaxID=126957 RepID=T1IMD4_STRMM